MKKTGLGITLALVIALASILGSIGVVSAARGHTAISPGTSVSINNVTDGMFYISYSLGGCAAQGYYITIRDDSSNDPHNPYVYCTYTDLTSSTKSVSSSEMIANAQANPGHAYTIGLYLAKNNGDIIECAYGSWQTSGS